MKRINIAWNSLTLTVTIVGLTNWDTISFHPLSGRAKAASTAAVLKLPDQFASSGRANGRIVFASPVGNSSGIQTMNADGSDRRRLTAGAEPSLSADGTQIAFVRTVGLQVEQGIYIMNADGSNQRQIAQAKGARSLTWSPDGTKIAFVTYEGSRVEPIYIITADGRNQRQIAQDKDIRFLGWSPDGTRLAFSSWDSGHVYLVNSDGSGQRIIRDDGYSASWAPDGSKLAIAGDDAALYLVDVYGATETRIAVPPGYDSAYAEPAWSPDGSKIYFTRWTGCDINGCYNPEIWTVNADGSNATQLSGLYGYGFKWSPDGTIVLFTNNSDLFVMNDDGSGITNITGTNDEYENGPSWGPVLSSCADWILPTRESFAAIGGTSSVDIVAGSDCTWSGSTYANWINLASAGSSNGNGRISYSVGANDSTSPRIGILFVANRTLLVTQAGALARITAISVAGKRLYVFGEHFDAGAVILLNGEAQKTKNDDLNPKSQLVGKKAGSKIKPGDRVQVLNPNGSLSNKFIFTAN